MNWPVLRIGFLLLLCAVVWWFWTPIMDYFASVEETNSMGVYVPPR